MLDKIKNLFFLFFFFLFSRVRSCLSGASVDTTQTHWGSMTHILKPLRSDQNVQTGFKPKRTLVFYVLIETFSCPTATEASQSCTVDAGGALQFPLLFWVLFFCCFFLTCGSSVPLQEHDVVPDQLHILFFFFYVVVTLRKNTQMKSSAH